MDEAMETPTLEEAPPETPPEPDLEAIKTSIAEERAALEKEKKALQKGFQEIARREKEVTRPPVDDDDTPDLDDAAKAALGKYMQKEYGGYFSGLEKLYEDMASNEVERYAKDHELDADDLRAAISDNGLAPQDPTISAVRDTLEKAARIVQSSKFDLDKERERLKAELREELAEQYEKGVNIEGLRPKRGEAAAPEGDIYEMTPEQRLAWYKEKGYIT